MSSTLKLIVGAGKAAPVPPIGPALGQRGVKSMDFCKQFNAKTAHLIPNIPTPTIVTINPDKTFSFVIKSPPTSWLLLKAAGLEKGSAKPKNEIVGKVSLKHIYEIAMIKQSDPVLANRELRAIASTIIGSANSMGIQVVV